MRVHNTLGYSIFAGNRMTIMIFIITHLVASLVLASEPGSIPQTAPTMSEVDGIYRVFKVDRDSEFLFPEIFETVVVLRKNEDGTGQVAVPFSGMLIDCKGPLSLEGTDLKSPMLCGFPNIEIQMDLTKVTRLDKFQTPITLSMSRGGRKRVEDAVAVTLMKQSGQNNEETKETTDPYTIADLSGIYKASIPEDADDTDYENGFISYLWDNQTEVTINNTGEKEGEGEFLVDIHFSEEAQEGGFPPWMGCRGKVTTAKNIVNSKVLCGIRVDLIVDLKDVTNFDSFQAPVFVSFDNRDKRYVIIHFDRFF